MLSVCHSEKKKQMAIVSFLLLSSSNRVEEILSQAKQPREAKTRVITYATSVTHNF